MSLNAHDQARLNRILELARKLEKAWPHRDRHQNVDLSGDPIYQELKKDIADCSFAKSESLSRLADRAGHLHEQVSFAHFFSCIVPFERLSGKSVRDDEFLVTEGDGRKPFNEGMAGGGFDSSLNDGVDSARLPLKVIVENMRSAFNVGAVFRTSECLGISEILLCGYTPDPSDEKTSKTSMGTGGMVPWRRVDRARTACEELRQQGYKIVALETAETAESLLNFEFGPQPTAFVLGNERFGIEGETLKAVDAICEIPLSGIKNSMNVGVAFGIGAFEWLRQYRKQK